jgi:hypothetical protein
MQTHVKKNPKINFTYLGFKEIYAFLRYFALTLFYFAQNAIYFIILYFPVQIIHFS